MFGHDTMEIDNSFYIGYISKTRGLKGELQLFFEFDDYKALDFDVLFLEIDRKLVPFFVESCKVQPNKTAFLFLEDVGHIDQSQPLVHKKAYLPNDKMPVRDPDDFRITDLKGYAVRDLTHGALGTISEIHEYPQQHIAVVPHRDTELMFPLNEDLITAIDRDEKTIEVDLPEGLLDVYLG